MPVISCADVVVGELENSWLTYGVVLETLCMKKPLIHRRDDALYKKEYDYLYPMQDASSPVEVARALQDVYLNKVKYLDEAELGYKWLHEYCIDKSLGNIIGLIEKKAEKVVAV